MAKSYRPVDRDQPMLLPVDMREWLPPDHLAWFVLEAVDALDTTGLERTRRRGGVGAAGYDPRMLFGLLVYAYCRGVRSSRQITHHPQHAAEMGMATPAELAALSTAQSNEFDILYLQLMIRHHQGALDMIEHVLIHGSDPLLAEWATDMLVTQQAQIFWMQTMLADKT